MMIYHSDEQNNKMERLYKTRYDRKKKKTYYMFRCECGRIIEKRSDSKTKYCGVSGCTFSKQHRTGRSNKSNKLYRRWEGIRSRVLGSHHTNTTYKGRGIDICDEWKYSFEAFEEWALTHGYSDDLTIDRIDIDGDYSPSNCRWITRSENIKNQHLDGHSTSVKVKIDNGIETHIFNSIKECYDFIKPDCKMKNFTSWRINKKGFSNGWKITRV